MEGVEGLERRNQDGAGVEWTEGAVGEPRGNALAVEQLHDEKRRAVVFADLVDRADARVGDARGRARLAQHRRGTRRTFDPQQLDRDVALEGVVIAGVHHAHAALAKAADDSKATDGSGILIQNVCATCHCTQLPDLLLTN